MRILINRDDFKKFILYWLNYLYFCGIMFMIKKIRLYVLQIRLSVKLIYKLVRRLLWHD